MVFISMIAVTDIKLYFKKYTGHPWLVWWSKECGHLWWCINIPKNSGIKLSVDIMRLRLESHRQTPVCSIVRQPVRVSLIVNLNNDTAIMVWNWRWWWFITVWNYYYPHAVPTRSFIVGRKSSYFIILIVII